MPRPTSRSLFRVNAVGPAILARRCNEIGAKLVQISTDYVFDGTAPDPYQEGAQPNPQSAYGRTKLAGEWAVRAELPTNYWILRTAWLYGEFGPNFVKTMVGLEGSRPELSVVDDQHGQPTWARHLAQRIIDVVDADVPPAFTTQPHREPPRGLASLEPFLNNWVLIRIACNQQRPTPSSPGTATRELSATPRSVDARRTRAAARLA